MKYKSRVIASIVVVVVFMFTGVKFLHVSHDLRYTQQQQQYKGVNHDVVKDHLKPRDLDVKADDKEKDSVKIEKDDHVHGADSKERYINKNGEDRKSGNQSNMEFLPNIVMFHEDIERLFNQLETIDGFGFSRQILLDTPFKEMALHLGRKSREKSSYLLRWDTHELRDDRTSNFVRFHHGIRAAALYNPEDPAVDGLLHDMATDTIKSLSMIESGTELKFLIRFRKGTKAVFKPMRWGREVETLPNHFYFNDFERHNSEIAAFHLDRILGFYRVPPVTGRFLNMTREIYDLGERALRRTFFTSPIGNTCFFGVCDYYCDSNHAFCGHGDMIEGSLMVWLPDGREAYRDSWKSPYRRSYSKIRNADWETNKDYCQNLMEGSYYLYKRFIPDLIDSHIFDFLTGNMDRHHVEVFAKLRNDSCPIHLDNGRGFGKANKDEISIIEPLKQCCRIRKSTFLKLSKLYVGPERLSILLDTSLRSDPVYPVVVSGHLHALDRRVKYMLTIVADCVEKYGYSKVILADGF
ncbi:Golgi casein kinase [Mactra antiquata]